MLGNVTKSQVLGSEMVLWTKLVSISYGWPFKVGRFVFGLIC